MRYIKTFEGLVDKPIFLRLLLVKFLSKTITSPNLLIHTNLRDRNQLDYVEYITIKDKRYNTIFQLNTNYLKDKKSKSDSVKHKQKIRVQLVTYYSKPVESDKEFVSLLEEFIIDVFTKHSFFVKKYYRNDCHDFYINTSDIDNIMNELNTDFEYYQSMKKYNL